MSLPLTLSQSLLAHKDRPVIITKSGTHTAGNILNTAHHIVQEQLNDISPGQRVALTIGNSPSYVCALLAVLFKGATAVPLNPAMTEHELDYVQKDCGFTTIMTDHTVHTRLSSFFTRRGLRSIIVSETCPERHVRSDIYTQAASDDEAIIYYTSGTTGLPKGVVLTHNNILTNAAAIVETAGFTQNDCLFNPLPMFHSFSATVCIIAPITIGASMVIASDLNPSGVIELLNCSQANILIGVPPIFALFLKTPETMRLDGIRLCISGGDALPAQLSTAFYHRFDVPIHQGYGLTEASPVCSVNNVNRPPLTGSIGSPVAGVSMQIVDDHMKALPNGSIGELAVKGPNVMKGYLNKPEETAAVIKDGWLLTGDMAMRDKDGLFYIVGRKKDLIIVGGLNVYPREVENILDSAPAIVRSAVIGMPDKLRGEVPHAIVQKCAPVTEKDLLKHCRLNLTSYKVPKRIHFIDEMPINRTGKVDKIKLRDIFSPA